MVRIPDSYCTGYAGLVSKFLFLTGIAVCVFLFSGFIRFSILVDSYDDLPDPTGDGIVVLTGGKARIETGLHLLEVGGSKQMLISGVNPQTSMNMITRMFLEHSEYFSCCIELDRIAKNTVQNAEEIAKWVKRRNIQSIVVVTSDYHMPRALLEITRVLPDVLLLPHVVRQQPAMKQNASADNLGDLKIVLKEFLKILISSMGRASWF